MASLSPQRSPHLGVLRDIARPCGNNNVCATNHLAGGEIHAGQCGGVHAESFEQDWVRQIEHTREFEVELMDRALGLRADRLRRHLMLGLSKGGVSLQTRVQGVGARRIPPRTASVGLVRRIVGEGMPPDTAGPGGGLQSCEGLKQAWIRLE